MEELNQEKINSLMKRDGNVFKTRYGEYTIEYIQELLDKQDKNYFEIELEKDIKERIYNYYCDIRSILCGNPCRYIPKAEVQSKIDYDLLYERKGYTKDLIDFVMDIIMKGNMR